ncbi:hypothetical protein [Methylobacterium longum]|uniref:hypothetical protein n=1 Tax=Methylobacterium longum TaxID=767694 RepID=UPI001EE33895|nr:hypothetical protein [Methylobacterium longum]
MRLKLWRAVGDILGFHANNSLFELFDVLAPAVHHTCIVRVLEIQNDLTSILVDLIAFSNRTITHGTHGILNDGVEFFTPGCLRHHDTALKSPLGCLEMPSR